MLSLVRKLKIEWKTVRLLVTSIALVISFAFSNQLSFADQVMDADNPATEGQKAPDFALPAEDGKTVRLSDFRGKRVVVFFYGKDTSPMSPEEAKEIQKYYDKFKLLDTDLLGIGTDPEASHKAMATGSKFHYHLLKDKDDEVRKLFRLADDSGRYGVLIDKNGVIKKIAGGENVPSSKFLDDLYNYVNTSGGGI